MRQAREASSSGTPPRGRPSLRRLLRPLPLSDILLAARSSNSDTRFPFPQKKRYKISCFVLLLSRRARAASSSSRLDFQIPAGDRITFLALVPGVALRAALRALAALVLVARPAHREPALGARHERLPVLSRRDLIAAHPARLHVRASDPRVRLRVASSSSGEKKSTDQQLHCQWPEPSNNKRKAG
jgi:hypothetical protein